MAASAQRASRFPLVYPLVLGLALASLSGPSGGVFERLDNLWSDHLFRFRGMEPGDPRVVLVTIDDESISRVGQFPWPRETYGRLLDRLYAAGVKVVGFDILFPDPSGTAGDRALVEATRKAGDRLVHSVSLDKRLSDRHAFVYPFEALRGAARHFGSVDQIFLDPDGSVRVTSTLIGTRQRAHYQSYLEDPEAKPSLGLAVLALYQGRDFRRIAREVGPRLRLNFRGEDVRIAGRTQEGPIYVPVYAYQRVPAWQLLEEGALLEADAAALKGAMALVGFTAVGNFDHYPSPFTASAPGVEVHATLIDNLLNGRWLREADILLSPALVAAMVLLSVGLMTLGPVLAALGMLAALASWAGLTYWLFAAKYYVLPFTAPAVALFGTFVGLMVHKTVMEGRRAREIRQMFGQYVSPEVVEVLVKNPGKLSLGGERRDMTMFFLDIAHFTTISEKMPPENLIQFLNHYLTALTDDVLRHKGVVDKYIGDCVMAFWNAPIEEPAHREKGCLAAVDCVKTIERLNREYVDPSMPEKPAVRIGLNSGEVIVGNTGSARKLAYTVLGDEVNLASRLEGANKFFGSTVIASENTYSSAKGSVEGRILGRVRVVGKEIPILIYELLARKGDLANGWAEALPVYHEAVDHYVARRFEEARKGFARVLELVPGDKPSTLYLSNCENYLVIPPPDNWEAVFNLTAK